MARIDDGFKTTLKFALTAGGASVYTLFFEKSVQPPGMAGGGSNDITTMLNTKYRTFAPKKLITMSSASFTAAYDPAVFNEIVTNMNKNGEWIITYPDATTLTFWGWLDEFSPNALVEGEQPTADCTIIPSNLDAAGAEIAPAHA